MSRFDTFIGTRRDESGAQLADLRADIDAKDDETAVITATTVETPVVDNTFTPIFTRGKKKNKIYVTLRFANFGTARDLKVVLVARNTIVTSDDYNNLRIQTRLTEEISDDAIAVQLVTSPLSEQFDPNTQYDIIRLVAIGAEGDDRASNPATSPEFASYPGNVLYTFTTPVAFGAPSAPDASLIVYNRLDETTIDIHDAVVGLKQHAPLTDANGAQTYEAAGVDWAESELTNVITGQPNEILSFRQYLNATELTQTDPSSTPANRGYVIIPCTALHPGREYTWSANKIHTVEEKRTTSGSVAFRAANLQFDLAQLTNTAVVVRDTDAEDGKEAEVLLELTQPSAQPVALKNGTLKYKKDSATNWKGSKDRWNECQSDAYHQVSLNAGTISGNTGTTTITGVGTSFTKLQAGWKIKVGAQTLTIADTPSTDTSLTVTANPSSNFSGQAFTVVMVIPIKTISVKPSTAYGVEFILRSRNDAKITLTASFTTDADGNVVNDTADPVISGTPIFQYERGKFFCKLAVANITNWNNPLKVEICITDNSSKSLNLDDLTTDTPAAVNTFYDIGKTATKTHVAISRDQVRRIFGATGTILLKFKLTNGTGVAVTSSASTALDLETLRDVTTLYNPNNIIRNGHFTFHNGTVAKRWKDYDPRSGTFGNVDQTGKLRFDQNEHRAKWRDTPTVDNQRFLAQNLGKTFMLSEYYSLIWNFYSNGTPTIDEIAIGLYVQKTLTNTISVTSGLTTVSGTSMVTTDKVKVGTVIGNGTEWRTVTIAGDSSLTVDRAWGATAAATSGYALIPQSTRLTQTSLALTTSDLIQKGLILTDSDLDTSLNIYFVVVLRDIVDTTTFPFIDAICMNAGQESAGYQRSIDSFETNDAGTSEDFDSAPTGGSSSGNQQLLGTGGDPGEVIRIEYS